MREVLLVSENSSSYGKDLGDIRLLERLLPQLAAVDGLEWVRVSYLQPAEMRPGLVEAIAGRPAWCRTSTCLSSTPRRRCCAGCAASAIPTRSSELLDSIRALAPDAGIRSNVICGFPGRDRGRRQTCCATS